MKLRQLSIMMGLVACFLPLRGIAADQASDRRAIEEQVASYAAAFNAGDVEKLSQHWSADGVYIQVQTGEQVEGRDAIATQFADMQKESKDVRLMIEVSSIEFLSPNVAMEKGRSQLVSPAFEPVATLYTAIHVKNDGVWLLDRVTEEEQVASHASYQHLKELEWMIGTWVDEEGGARVETTCAWTKDQSFMTRAFTISIADRIDMSGMQIIGWDAGQGRIRSWVFDSDGGFGEATWRKKEGRWVIEATATLPDGRKSSAINIMTADGDDAFTWQSIGRELDGEILPNIDPVKIVRSQSADAE